MNRKAIAFLLGIAVLGIVSYRKLVTVPQLAMSATGPTPSRQPASNPPERQAAKPELKSNGVPFKEIEEVANCYRSTSCDFPQTDPRSYDIAVGRALAEKTMQVHRQFRSVVNSQHDLGRLARFTFSIQDGFVQSAALDIFADLSPSEENLAALHAGLENNPDPLIAEKAVKELSRYIGTPFEAKMQETVKSMLGGAHFAAQKVSENILGFINEGSFPAYQQIQRQLPAGSRLARNLGTALQEYRRQQTGG